MVPDLRNAQPGEHCLDLPIRDGKGNIKPLLAKCVIALRYAPEWQGVLGAYSYWGYLTVIRETKKATPWGDGPQAWTNDDDLRLTEWLQLHGIDVSVKTAKQAVRLVRQDDSECRDQEIFKPEVRA